jgi:two-component system, cell cycle sensor histidine kinase and response regulator CckA
MVNGDEHKPIPSLQVLLVGGLEQDFSTLRDLLDRSNSVVKPQLEHIASRKQALVAVAQNCYDMIVAAHEKVDEMSMRLLQENRRRPVTVPFIFLAEHADQATAAAVLKSGACDYLERSQLSEIRLARTIRCASRLRSQAHECEERKETLRKLSRVVEQSADLVTITDCKGLIEYVNPAFEELTGYRREEVLGSTPRVLKSGEQKQNFYEELWNTILGGRVFRGAIVDRKKSGELFYIEKTIAPVRDNEGRITHFVSTDRDISEKYKLEAQLRQSQKMDAVGQLAGGVAHDFNNLLMVIRSYSELMLDTITPEQPLHHNIEEIIKAANRAADLTRQLLAFSRKQMQNLQVLQLNQSVRNIVQLMPRLIGEDIQLTFLPGEALNSIKADPMQIEQIVMNLATNARDAMPTGGNLVIETSNVRLDETYAQNHQIVPPGDYVLLTVSDSGQGIGAEHLPHIFEPFYTTKDSGKGTGLGLATVYGIVKQNGGFIWAYSEPGMGTTFKIYWPRVQSAENKRVVSSNPACSTKGSETIMLVEDEEAVRGATGEFLTKSGYTVLQAKDGVQALENARSHSGTIDLLISDVVMPRMSGGELIRHLAAERPSMKVLFVSGYAEKTVSDHGVMELSDNFLQKPFALSTLALKIRQVLGGEAELHP